MEPPGANEGKTMTTIIYRVTFVSGITEAAAREAAEGLNGGNVGGIRTADLNGVTTAWFSVQSDVEGPGTLGQSDAERAVDAELDADERVEAYSATV